MAAIAAGSMHSLPGLSHPDGHAPDAGLIDIAITQVPQLAWPSTGRWDSGVWTTDNIVVLAGIQALRDWMLTSNQDVHVLNFSFDGWSDPHEPVCIALDELAVDEDMLVVTSAGNSADDTRLCNGFYNGLAVGAVHARVNATEPFVALGPSAHGPLASDPNRFYPDVCATGGGPGLPGVNRFRYALDRTSGVNPISYLVLPRIDSRDSCSRTGSTCVPFTPACGLNNLGAPFLAPVPANVHLGQGTSEAAPQVAGAAALYRATRPQATAEEAKAAILLSVVSCLPGEYGGTPPAGTGQDQDTYHNRNSFGVGYVRDDFLAEFAVRDPLIDPLAGSVMLTGPSAQATLSMPSLSSGQRYAVTCCWPRRYSVEGSFLIDVDMEVREIGNPGNVIARSSSRGNSYERTAFVAPASTNGFEVRVFQAAVPAAVDPLGLPVTIAARRFEPDMDPASAAVEFVPAHAASGSVDSVEAGLNPLDCTGVAPRQIAVDWVPNVYERAWGSGPLQLPFVNLNGGFSTLPPSYRGWNLKQLRPVVSGQTAGWNFHVEVDANLLSLNGPTVIRGVAFRTWRPFVCSGALTVNRFWVGESTGALVTATSLAQSPSNLAATLVLSGAVSVPRVASSMAGIVDYASPRFSDYAVEVLFQQPYTYSGNGNLHMWMECTGGEYEVDFANDAPDINGNGTYGCYVGASGPPPGAQALVGTCPIFALLGDVSVEANVRPRLEVHGEPMVGRSIEVQGHLFPASSLAVLFYGEWSPGVALWGSCQQHLIPSGDPFLATVQSNGWVRWDLQGPAQNPTVPLDPALLSQVVGLQAWLPSTGILSNALRVLIGGGL